MGAAGREVGLPGEVATVFFARFFSRHQELLVRPGKQAAILERFCLMNHRLVAVCSLGFGVI